MHSEPKPRTGSAKKRAKGPPASTAKLAKPPQAAKAAGAAKKTAEPSAKDGKRKAEKDARVDAAQKQLKAVEEQDKADASTSNAPAMQSGGHRSGVKDLKRQASTKASEDASPRTEAAKGHTHEWTPPPATTVKQLMLFGSPISRSSLLPDRTAHLGWYRGMIASPELDAYFTEFARKRRIASARLRNEDMVAWEAEHFKDESSWDALVDAEPTLFCWFAHEQMDAYIDGLNACAALPGATPSMRNGAARVRELWACYDPTVMPSHVETLYAQAPVHVKGGKLVVEFYVGSVGNRKDGTGGFVQRCGLDHTEAANGDAKVTAIYEFRLGDPDALNGSDTVSDEPDHARCVSEPMLSTMLECWKDAGLSADDAPFTLASPLPMTVGWALTPRPKSADEVQLFQEAEAARAEAAKARSWVQSAALAELEIAVQALACAARSARETRLAAAAKMKEGQSHKATLRFEHWYIMGSGNVTYAWYQRDGGSCNAHGAHPREDMTPDERKAAVDRLLRPVSFLGAELTASEAMNMCRGALHLGAIFEMSALEVEDRMRADPLVWAMARSLAFEYAFVGHDALLRCRGLPLERWGSEVLEAAKAEGLGTIPKAALVWADSDPELAVERRELVATVARVSTAAVKWAISDAALAKKRLEQLAKLPPGLAAAALEWAISDDALAKERLSLLAKLPLRVAAVVLTWAISDPALAKERLSLVATVAGAAEVAQAWAISDPALAKERLKLVAKVAGVAEVAQAWAVSDPALAKERLSQLAKLPPRLAAVVLTWAVSDDTLAKERLALVAKVAGVAEVAQAWAVSDPALAKERLSLLAKLPRGVAAVALTWAISDPALAKERLALVATVAGAAEVAQAWAISDPALAKERLKLVAKVARGVAAVVLTWAISDPALAKERLALVGTVAGVAEVAQAWAVSDDAFIEARLRLVAGTKGTSKERVLAALASSGDAKVAAFTMLARGQIRPGELSVLIAKAGLDQ